MTVRRPLAALTGWVYRVSRRVGLTTAASRQQALQGARALPTSSRIVRAGRAGGDPLRVLLLGNGPAESPGLPEGSSGFAGLLAQSFSTRTARPVEVTTLVGEAWDLPSLRTALREVQLAQQDVLVVSAAYRPRLAEIPFGRWQAYTEGLRAALIEEAGPTTVIRVLSLPWREAARSAPEQWGGLFGNRVTVVAEMAEAVLRPDQRALPLRLHGPLRRTEWIGPAFSAQTYARWADQVAAEVASAHGR